MSGGLKAISLVAVIATLFLLSAPQPASALSASGVACSLTGLVSGALGKVCTAATHAGSVISAGKKLIGGHVGGAVSALTGSAPRAATTTLGLAAIAAAVVGGARYALRATAALIGATTSPNLESTWFSAFYWRMAAVSALLTVPFLCAAAIQALVRSDLTLLARAAFGYLPLGLLAVGVAAPLTMLLLAGSDEMSSIVASASGDAGARFLNLAGGVAGVVSIGGGNLFVAFFVGLLTAAATIVLWIELLIRQAAVYVIVLMLPLFFAAMVWPARRVWALRAVELLVALILSKFAIVAVLALGGAALGHTLIPGPQASLAGATLVLLASFSPWALLRLLPLHEVAGAAAAGLSRPGVHGLQTAWRQADGGSDHVDEAAAELPARLLALTRAEPSRRPFADETGAAADADPAAAAPGAPLASGGPAPGSASLGDPAGQGDAPTGHGDAPAGHGNAPTGHGDAPGGQNGPPAGQGAPPAGQAGRATDDDGPAQASAPLPHVFRAADGTWRTLGLNAEDLLSDRPLLDDEPATDGGGAGGLPRTHAQRPHRDDWPRSEPEDELE